MGKERNERHLGLMWIVMYELLMLGNLDVLGNLMFKLFMKWRGLCWILMEFLIDFLENLRKID